MMIYLVGGAVRDQILNIPVYDRDWVVVGTSPQKMLENGYKQVGKDFPVFIHPKTKEEYALARTEKKQGKGYHGFNICTNPKITLEEDLKRRDLTINAIAKNSNTNQVIDPYNGQHDIDNRLLRHVSSAFKEDPLRVLRVARFSAKLATFNFKITPETQQLMTEMTNSGELNNLTPERVWQETVKALNTSKPSMFFMTLHKVGALKILFPEIEILFQVPQSKINHPEGNVGIHTMKVLDISAKLFNKLHICFACLMHDVGKAKTDKKYLPKHPKHEQQGVEIVKQFCNNYKIPKNITQFTLLVTRWHGDIHRGLDYANTHNSEKILQILNGTNAYKNLQTFHDLLNCCHADSLGRKGFENTKYPQLNFWKNAQKISNEINVEKIIQQGKIGKEIQESIKSIRLKKLQKWLKSL